MYMFVVSMHHTKHTVYSLHESTSSVVRPDPSTRVLGASKDEKISTSTTFTVFVDDGFLFCHVHLLSSFFPVVNWMSQYQQKPRRIFAECRFSFPPLSTSSHTHTHYSYQQWTVCVQPEIMNFRESTK